MNAETVAAPAVSMNMPIRGEPEAYRESRWPAFSTTPVRSSAALSTNMAATVIGASLLKTASTSLVDSTPVIEQQGDAAHRDDIDAEALRHHGREHHDQQREHEIWLDEIPGHAVIPIRLRA